MARVNDAIVERLERVIETLSDNSIKMGQMLAVHDEKLDKQDRIDAVLFEKVESLHREVNRQSAEIKAGCERDIRKVDERLRLMEKKMWSIFGALAVISFVVSPVGQRIVGTALTPTLQSSIIENQ
jgi:CII-binding regulator of phage lambda lysogenization HflD